MKLAIRFNTLSGAIAECALCGSRAEVDTGSLELFLESSGGFVCRTCGRKYAPQLADLLEADECTLFDNVAEVFVEGEHREVIWQVMRKDVRAIMRGEQIPWLSAPAIAEIRAKYSARSRACFEDL